ncbi:MAG: glycosyltransferase family 4 protein, partial [Acidimicrobiales bacterium]
DPIITLSASSKTEIVERLGFSPDRVTVASPGIDPRFSVGGEKDPQPLVVAVGRLVPVKRFDWFIDAMAKLRADHPSLRAVVVGEGYERPSLEARIAAAGAEQWLTLPGRVSDEALVDLYRRAWLVVSTSAREGWGMTLTEAGACGTPSVATRIAGHQDALVDGVSGMLADTMEDIAIAASGLLADDELRARLSLGALRVAKRFAWDETALATFGVLAAEARLVQGRRQG